jgi:hypothetical protein
MGGGRRKFSPMHGPGSARRTPDFGKSTLPERRTMTDEYRDGQKAVACPTARVPDPTP